MFAYCGNNPICYGDPDGYYQIPSTKAFGLRSLDSEGNDPWTNLMHNRIPDSPGRLRDKKWYDFLVSDIPPNIVMGLRKASKGISAIKDGFSIAALPIPTLTDELIGLGLIIKGSIQLIFATGKIFSWGEGFE